MNHNIIIISLLKVKLLIFADKISTLCRRKQSVLHTYNVTTLKCEVNPYCPCFQRYLCFDLTENKLRIHSRYQILCINYKTQIHCKSIIESYFNKQIQSNQTQLRNVFDGSLKSIKNVNMR